MDVATPHHDIKKLKRAAGEIVCAVNNAGDEPTPHIN